MPWPLVDRGRSSARACRQSEWQAGWYIQGWVDCGDLVPQESTTCTHSWIGPTFFLVATDIAKFDGAFVRCYIAFELDSTLGVVLNGCLFVCYHSGSAGVDALYPGGSLVVKLILSNIFFILFEIEFRTNSWTWGSYLYAFHSMPCVRMDLCPLSSKDGKTLKLFQIHHYAFRYGRIIVLSEYLITVILSARLWTTLDGQSQRMASEYRHI